MNRRPIAVALALAGCLTVAACGEPAPPRPAQGVEFELEDCDAGDALEGDSDCTASQIKKARAKAKAAKSRAVAPKVQRPAAPKPRPAAPARRK